MSVLAVGPVLLHGAGHAEPPPVPTTAVIVLLAGAWTVAYVLGVRRLPGGSPWGRPLRPAAFVCGLLVLVAVVVPAVGERLEETFPAHMVQHMVLLLVAAPLLALGAPAVPMLATLPLATRRTWQRWRRAWPARTVQRIAASALLAGVVQSAVVWLWHLPTPYRAALESSPLHLLEHLSYLVTGWWFWWHLVRTGRKRLTGPSGVLHVFLAALPMSALGAVLTLAPRALLPEQTGTGAAGLAQQQLAGLIMWIPPDVVYLTVCAGLMVGWLNGLERSSPGRAPMPPLAPSASTREVLQ